MGYLGQVVRADGQGVWVRVADLHPEFVFGPCRRVGAAPPAGAQVLLVDVSRAGFDPDLVVVGALS